MMDLRDGKYKFKLRYIWCFNAVTVPEHFIYRILSFCPT